MRPSYRRALLYLMTKSVKLKRSHIINLSNTRMVAFLYRKTVPQVADDTIKMNRKLLTGVPYNTS